MNTSGKKAALVPTGNCFDDALAFFVEHLVGPEDDRDLSHLRLVHGVCHMSDGQANAHAWVEDRHASNAVPVAWQGSVLRGEPVWFAMAIDDFHQTYRVGSCTRYTYEKALIANKLSGHLGPWRAEYLALTAEGGGVSTEPRDAKHGAKVLKVIPRMLLL